MQSLAGLTDQVKIILIQGGGQQPRHEVYNHFINDCTALNLTEDDFYKKVLAPASKSINWEQVEEEQKKKAAAEKAAQAAAAKLAEQQVSLKYIHQEVKTSFDSGVVPAVELNDIFRRAEAAGQNITQLADYIHTQIDKYGFKPYPSANTSAPDVKTKLLSTNWYDAWHYTKLNTPAEPVSAPLPTPPAQPSPPPLQPVATPAGQPPVKKDNSPLAKALLTTLLVLLLVGGFLGYLLWWKPYAREKNAPRMYTIADSLWLRTSPVAKKGLQNTLQQLGYGTELIVYDSIQHWMQVKANGQEGYVNSNYLMEQRSFYEMNSIFADEASRSVVAEPRVKRALLDYFQTHSLMGKMEPNLQVRLYGKLQQKEVWQLFAKERSVTPNTVYYKKIVSSRSRFKDFAFVITNGTTQRRKFVLYRFSSEEDPVFVYEEDAPDYGDIMSVNKNGSDDGYRVRYTD